MDTDGVGSGSTQGLTEQTQSKWFVVMCVAVTFCCVLYVVDYFTAAKSRIEKAYMQTPMEKYLEEFEEESYKVMPDFTQIFNGDDYVARMKEKREERREANSTDAVENPGDGE